MKRSLLAALVLLITAQGCTHSGTRGPGEGDIQNCPATGTESCSEFRHALATCRSLHAGQGSRSLQMPPTETHVAACLRSKGWLPSGVVADSPLPP